jgi:hypothetical protein
MNFIEETVDAVPDSNGQLRLTHQPRLPPGPVRMSCTACRTRTNRWKRSGHSIPS